MTLRLQTPRPKETMIDRARRYVTLGLSLIHLKPHQKIPAFVWKEYQTRHPTEEELAVWFGEGDYNLAIVCGAVSGVVVVDTDSDEAEAWAKENLPATPMMCRTVKGLHR